MQNILPGLYGPNFGLGGPPRSSLSRARGWWDLRSQLLS